MKYTEKMKVDGELAVRRLSEEAAEYYNGTDPLTVFAYENEDGEMRYSYSYSTNPYAGRYKSEDLTFEELQEAFEEAQKELDKQLEADGEPDYSEIDMEQYEQKIKDTMEQLTEKEEELLSSFLPAAIVADAFNTSTEVKAVKDKYNLNWREIRGTAFRLQGKMRTEPEKQSEPTNVSTPQAADKIGEENLSKKAIIKTDGNAWFITDESDHSIILEPNKEDYLNLNSNEEFLKSVSENNPDYADYINSHISELSNDINIINKMLSMEAIAVERDRLAAELGAGGGYGEDMANSAAEKRLAYLEEELEDMQSAAKELLAQKELSEPEQIPQPDEFLTGDYIRTPRGSFSLISLSREHMQAAGYGLHHESEDGKYYIMGNGTQAFAVEKQSEPTNISTLQAADKTAADSMKYNGGTFLAGVAACAQLGKKAAEYFNTHILSVFEYENENGEKRYAYAHDNDENPKRAEDLTFEELQRAFEDMQSQTEEMLEAKQPGKTEKNHEFEYQLLDRLRSDCEYFLGAGNRVTKNLWAGNVEEQIAKMRELYNILPEKPEWLTEQDIDHYEKLMTTDNVPEMQSDEKELIALLTVKQCGFTKYCNMGDASMDDIFRQLKKAANPFIETKGEVISDEGRFAELEQSGKVSVSVTADIDNDSITVYEINGVPEEKRTDENTRIWHRSKMSNFLKDRVREPKTDNSQHSPYHGVGRSHVSEHEREM